MTEVVGEKATNALVEQDKHQGSQDAFRDQVTGTIVTLCVDERWSAIVA